MKRQRFLYLLLIPFLSIIVLTLAGLALYAAHEFRINQMAVKRATLKSIGSTLAKKIDSAKSLEDLAYLQAASSLFATEFNVRVTIVAPDGRVIFDSEKNPDAMQNHGTRPEVMEAFQGRAGYDMHFSKELGKHMVYCAVPVMPDGTHVIAAVRCSYMLADIQAGLWPFYREMLIVGGLALIFAAFFACLIARFINRPLQMMREGTLRFAAGDFSQRIASSSNIEELGQTTDAVNRMAGEIAARITAIERERSEKEKILSSMSEGVLALDAEDRILYLNNAMVRIFNLNRETALGRFLHEVIRIPEIQRLVSSSLHGEEKIIEEQITFTSPTEKSMQAHAVPLAGPNGKSGGALLVFNDITQLTRLERTRQDFVANVSHELRTPITSIMGFVETLLEGAASNPDKAQRFLSIIKTQTARMVSIIDDLLLLSRLDSRTEMPMELLQVQSLLSCVMDTCGRLAEKKSIRIEMSVETGMDVRGNGHLLEQALINLINNAIHYSNALTTVHVRAHRIGNEAVIAVIDEGCGISAANLPRIFERFFRVDKARSPNGGGTGLGLSIVKHIALVHNGRVEVESQLGRGSTFRLILPLPQPQSES